MAISDSDSDEVGVDSDSGEVSVDSDSGGIRTDSHASDVHDSPTIWDGVEDYTGYNEDVQPLFPDVASEHTSDLGESLGPSHVPEHLDSNLDGEILEQEEVQQVDNETNIDAMKAKMLNGYTLDPLGRPERHANGPRKLSACEEMSLRHYLAWQKSGGTVAAYEAHAENLSFYTNTEILSLFKVRALAEELTGIKPIMVDMCPNGCMAFVGKHENDEFCQGAPKETSKGRNQSAEPTVPTPKVCGHPRYIPHKGPGKPRSRKPYKHMTTVPVLEVIRAMFANAETSKQMRYRNQMMIEAVHAAHSLYSDFGNSEIQKTLYDKGLFEDPRTMAYVYSSDGAMLTLQKQSEFWVAMLLNLNVDPSIRYMIEWIIIMFIIPGPHAPGNLESFFYVTFVHMLQATEGIWMYDAYECANFIFKAYMVGFLADMMGSMKVNSSTGPSGVYACRFSKVAGCRPGIGKRRQYFAITSEYIAVANPTRDKYDYYMLPMRNEKEFMETIEKLNNETSSTARKLIIRNSGVTHLPMFAASPGWTYPTFYPMDCLHQLYANHANHIHRLNIEIGLFSNNRHAKFGAMLDAAMKTLPPIFCGPVRNIAEKINTNYKLYEWMAVVHWYTVPLMHFLHMDARYIDHYASFVQIAEQAMLVEPKSEEDLQNLTDLIVEYLTDFERLYIHSPEHLTRARVTTFQLIHIPYMIRSWGTYRGVSQATCERLIGWMGRKVKSKKAPDANLSNLVLEGEKAKCLQLLYPQLKPREDPKPAKLLVKHHKFTSADMKEYSAYTMHLKAIVKYMCWPTDVQVEGMTRWGKLCLSNGQTLRSRINEETATGHSRSQRYFEAVIDNKPRWGEVLAFYHHAGTRQVFAVFNEIENIQIKFRTYNVGRLGEKVSVMKAKDIKAIVGIIENGDETWILRKHAALSVLASVKSGAVQEKVQPGEESIEG